MITVKLMKPLLLSAGKQSLRLHSSCLGYSRLCDHQRVLTEGNVWRQLCLAGPALFIHVKVRGSYPLNSYQIVRYYSLSYL